MSKNKLIRPLLAVLFFLGLVVMVSGCTNTATKNEANNDPYNFYNKVQVNQLRSDVETALGVTPVEKDGAFIYTDLNTDFGVTINYDTSDSVALKTLYNADESKMMALSNSTVTEDQLASITEGMTYEEVKAILGGDGKELLSRVNPVDKNNPINVMIWFNNDETGFYVTFIGEKGMVKSVKYWK